jgi:hypothetical protein
MAKIPITYTGSNTDELYVLALRKGKEVKLRVKELDCHGAITAEAIVEDNKTFTDEASLIEAKDIPGALTNGTVYTVPDKDNNPKDYIYYNNILSPLNGINEENTTIIDGLDSGAKYESLEKLIEAKNLNLLETKKIYTVDDNGTIEQYIYKDKELHQISGATNEVISGSLENEDEVSSLTKDEDGIIDYNLTELKNGNYRYKNHSNLREVYCDMPNLVSGVQMFFGTSLVHFCGNLDSLEDGTHMFSKGCKLDTDSIYNIVDGIKTHTKGIHTIDIGYDSSEITEDFLAEISEEFSKKNWKVTWFKDGSLTS